LNITQKGTPNEADCVCYTDVAYTIKGISQTEVNVIFINGVQVYCYNENDKKNDVECKDLDGVYTGTVNVYISSLHPPKVKLELLENNRYVYYAQLEHTGGYNEYTEVGAGSYSVKNNKITFVDEWFRPAIGYWDPKLINYDYYYTFDGKILKLTNEFSELLLEKQDVDVNYNKVLMLTVDYTTNTFKGGKELLFTEQSETFTITYEFKQPGDFGHIKLFYQEINELLFFGTIIWMGCGEMVFPQNLLAANQFQAVVRTDWVVPKNGFEDIFPQHHYTTYDYELIYGRVQSLVKAREYLRSNPEQVVKMFLYTPSVGCGDPEDWYWIIFLTQ